MIHIKFKNLEKSEMAQDVVNERFESLLEKFPDLRLGDLRVTLEMENSPIQAGPDYFNVKVRITSGRYRGIIVEKGQPNLYTALAEVIDLMLEKLNRYGDRMRVKERNAARKIDGQTMKYFK